MLSYKANRVRKRFFLSFVFLTVLSLNSLQVFASHSMGADLTYQCLGGNNYRLRLSFYRDCDGATAPIQAIINVSSASCGISFDVFADTIPNTGKEITPICPTMESTCGNGTFTGIQEWIYEADVTLPMECSDWTFSYELCCRNSAITNISNPSGENIYVYSMLNNTNGVCNNSPTFANKPVPFICLDQQFCFNHGSSDIDGDSLVYTPITPMTSSGGWNVTYLPGFTSTQPLTSNPAATFNTVTGDICMTPKSLEVTVMAVLVSEYRNGVLIGQVERDMQVTVLNCNNNLPVLSGINGTNSFSTTACANSSFCFEVFTGDADPGQNLSISWDGTIGGGMFTSSGGAHPVGEFCWTPMPWSVSTTPKCFTITVKDDACPYRGSQTFSYCITVVDAKLDAGSDTAIQCNGRAVLNATANSSLTPVNFLWNTGATTTSINAGAGDYVVTVNNALCHATDTVRVLAPNGPVADFGFQPACNNAPVIFSDLTAEVSPITSWKWHFGDNTTSVDSLPVHQYPATGNYNAILIVEDINGCIDSVWKPVAIQSPPDAAFTASAVCPGYTLPLVNTSTGTDLQYAWNNGNGQSSNDTIPEFVFNTGGNYTVSLQVTDSLGCIDSLSRNIIIPEDPVANIGLPSALCEGNPILLSGSSQIPVNSWAWDLGSGTVSVGQNYTANLPAGQHNVQLSLQTLAGCRDTAIMQVIVSPAYIAPSIIPDTVCKGETAVLSANTTNSCVWSNGVTSSSISVSPASSTTYTVTITNSSGCSDTTVSHVTVKPLPVVSAGNNVVICQGDSTVLSATGADNYQWLSGVAASDYTVRPNQETLYTVVGTAINGCTATDTVRVFVNTLPLASFTAANSCNSSPVAFQNNSSGNIPLAYQWNFGDTTAIVSNQHPVHLYQHPSSYNVHLQVTDVNGCTGSVSRPVVILPDPQVSIQFDTVPGCYFNEVTYHYTGSDPFHEILWNMGNGIFSTQSAPQATYYTEGFYPVSITCVTNEGCTARASVNTFIDLYPLPVADFRIGGEPVQFMPVFFDNFSTLSDYWEWNFGDGDTSSMQHPQYVFEEVSSYTIEMIASNSYGCRDTAYETIQIKPGWLGWIPNSFTPDDDGINDVFLIYGQGIESYLMSIYNRWGELIYQGKNEGWNGLTDNGSSQAKQDVYVYEISIRDVNGNSHDKNGRVTLIR